METRVPRRVTVAWTFPFYAFYAFYAFYWSGVASIAGPLALSTAYGMSITRGYSVAVPLVLPSAAFGHIRPCECKHKCNYKACTM